jgi:hypothetical protein
MCSKSYIDSKCTPIYMSKISMGFFLLFILITLFLLLISISMIVQGCPLCLDGPIIYETFTLYDDYYVINYDMCEDCKGYIGVAILHSDNYKYECSILANRYNKKSEEALITVIKEYPKGTKKNFFVNSWSGRCFDDILISKKKMFYQYYVLFGTLMLFVWMLLMFVCCCVICRCYMKPINFHYIIFNNFIDILLKIKSNLSNCNILSNCIIFSNCNVSKFNIFKFNSKSKYKFIPYNANNKKIIKKTLLFDKFVDNKIYNDIVFENNNIITDHILLYEKIYPNEPDNYILKFSKSDIQNNYPNDNNNIITDDIHLYEKIYYNDPEKYILKFSKSDIQNDNSNDNSNDNNV